MTPKYRFQWYQQIHENRAKIHEDAREAARELGLEKWRDRVGLYAGSSSCPGPLPGYVLDAIVAANTGPLLPMRAVEDELRGVVKDLFGDEYDGAVTNTCEAALRVSFETLFAPPTMRKGETYRGRFIAPYGEDYEFMAAYGRPFPPRYKNLIADRAVTGGELAVEGKSLPNLDAVFVRLAGARYEGHGIRFNPVPLLTATDAAETRRALSVAAERHASQLVGFESIGYDTPGYGYGEQDDNGVPLLKKYIGELAREFDVPYIVDAASCCPVIGLSPADIGADVMLWSMDKACRAPISGLLVGREECMVPIRKGLGLGGTVRGGVTSHGKAVFSLVDPGRDAVVGLTAVLKVLRDEPERVTGPIDAMHSIVVEEFSCLQPERFREDLIITKSYTMGGIEVNYEQTWKDGDFGVPIFALEDLFADSNPIGSAMDEMGIHPATIYSGNMFLGPGMGTLADNGELIEEPTRLAVRALVRATNIVCKHAGLVS